MPDPVMSSFDAPNGDFACARRVRSNTPSAALVGLNEPIFVEAAQDSPCASSRNRPLRCAEDRVCVLSLHLSDADGQRIGRDHEIAAAATGAHRRRLVNPREIATGNPAQLPRANRLGHSTRCGRLDLGCPRPTESRRDIDQILSSWIE